MAVEGVARQAAGADHELPARCRAIGGGERDLAAEFEARARLALADALHFRGVQRVDLLATAVLAPLAQQLGDALERRGKGGAHRLGGTGDLARDIARQPSEPGAQAADLALGLAVAAAMAKLRDLATGKRRDPCLAAVASGPRRLIWAELSDSEV